MERKEVSLETRKKLSELRKGYKWSDNQREKFFRTIETRKPIVFSEEHRKKISQRNSGRSQFHPLGCKCAIHLRRKIQPRTFLEKKLKEELIKDGKIGIEEQVRFGKYVVDFFDRENRTAWEADGSYWHDSERDKKRDSELKEQYNIFVARVVDGQNLNDAWPLLEVFQW